MALQALIVIVRFFLFRLKLKWLKNGGVRVFIAPCIFLRTITFFIKKILTLKTILTETFLIILKTYIYYLRHRFANQK